MVTWLWIWKSPSSCLHTSLLHMRVSQSVTHQCSLKRQLNFSGSWSLNTYCTSLCTAHDAPPALCRDKQQHSSSSSWKALSSVKHLYESVKEQFSDPWISPQPHVGFILRADIFLSGRAAGRSRRNSQVCFCVFQIEACSKEAEKIDSLINYASPTLVSQVPLSAFLTSEIKTSSIRSFGVAPPSAPPPSLCFLVGLLTAAAPGLHLLWVLVVSSQPSPLANFQSTPPVPGMTRASWGGRPSPSRKTATASFDNHSHRLPWASNNQDGGKAVNVESFGVNRWTVLFSRLISLGFPPVKCAEVCEWVCVFDL